MTVKELLREEVDVDVCDDYDESCYIAFCGPVYLTEYGEEKFASVLNCEVDYGEDTAVISVDTGKQLKLLCKLFYGAAGYVSEDEYRQLFK